MQGALGTLLSRPIVSELPMLHLVGGEEWGEWHSQHLQWVWRENKRAMGKETEREREK